LAGRALPLPPRRLPATAQLAAGAGHSLLVRPDGSLYAWGSNANGQLGNNSTTDSSVPVAVSLGAAPAGTRFVQVAAGNSYSLALTADGTLYAWGDNSKGQLGNTTTTQSNVPVAVSQGATATTTRFVQVAAGQYHSLAVTADGTLYAWGDNSKGQLGNNSTTQSNVPAAVSRGAGATTTLYKQVAAGYFHSLAVSADGTLYAWGDNSKGQLGNNSTTNSSVLVAVSQGAGATTTRFGQVAAGQYRSLALAADGTRYAWGDNTNGQLGNNSTTQSNVLVAVSLGAAPAGTSFTQVALGSAGLHALAADGSVYAWGTNTSGQLGNNSTTNSSVPVAAQAPATTGYVQAAGAGGGHSLGLRADGTLYAWGQNNLGQLGNNTTTNSLVPAAVSLGAAPAGTRFGQTSAGSFLSLALAANGTLYAWGYNIYGELGNNTTTSSSVPVAVSAGAVPTGTRFVQVAAGSLHALTLTANGTLYAWGSNSNGQLGNNSTTNSSVPVAVSAGAVPTDTRFVQVATGYYHSLALAADGKIYAWGSNSNGQLGSNSTTDSSVPVAEASGLTQWRSLATSPNSSHSLVLGAGAAIFTAGYNANGQLGDGTTTDSPVFPRNQAPLPVQLTTFTARSAGPTSVQLAWATASELTSAYFAVERSRDGVTFAELGRVGAAGSSTTARTYSHTDAALPAGATLLYYRLRQVDLDGTATYSPVRAVALRGAAVGLALYPNPAQAGTTLTGAAPGAVVQVLDGLGRPVLSTAADAAGTAPLVLPAGLAPGVYLVRTGAQALRLSVQ